VPHARRAPFLRLATCARQPREHAALFADGRKVDLARLPHPGRHPTESSHISPLNRCVFFVHSTAVIFSHCCIDVIKCQALTVRDKEEAYPVSVEITNDQEIRSERTFITRPQLARRYGKSPRFWLRLEKAGLGPPVVYLGKTPLYRVSAVDAWLISQEQGTGPHRKKFRRVVKKEGQ
jgi:hypothetical protein